MATAINPFQDIRMKAGDVDRSLNWYQIQVKNLKNVRPNTLMKSAPDLTTVIVPGNMYMFFYDAKLKDKLPYWDMFPLVLPFRKVDGGFFGLNLHYLPYPVRFKLLGYMHALAYDSKVTESTRLQLNWRILNASSRYAPVKACVKHYLYSQLESRFLKVHYPDWITASQLPVERFVGANKQEVWRQSREKY